METEFDWSKITDDTMFENVMNDPVTCKLLIEAILPDLKINEIEVHTQKRVRDDKKRKATIFDVWVKDDQGRQYDVEMQLGEKKGMDLRARYYLSRLDSESLHAGKHYSELEAAYVIFICGFDPKRLDLKEYDFKYYCKQDKSLALETKTEIIYLNSKGTKGKVSEGVQDLFNMMNNDAPTKTNFAEQAKDRMLAYSRTPEWREHEMYIDAVIDKTKKETTKEVTREVTKEAITKLVTVLKSDGMDEAVVLNILVKTYGDKYSEGELKKFIDEAK